MSRPNPFAPAAEDEPIAPSDKGELPMHDPVLGHRLMESGPERPGLLPISQEDGREHHWPISQIATAPVTGIAVMGLHGGAGATTVHALFEDEGVRDHGQGWPVAADDSAFGVVAVARTHWRGLHAADQFTKAWATGALPDSPRLLALILVDDGPKLADAQKKMMRRLMKRTPKAGHLPWVEAWRHLPLERASVPAKHKRLTRAIRSEMTNIHNERNS